MMTLIITHLVFTKIIRNFTEKHYGNNPYGYLHVEHQHHRPLHEHYMEAGKEMGFSIVDFNGPQTTGFGVQEVVQKNGKRHSVYDAFLKDFEYRSNLRISRYSTAIKIALDKKNHARGVWYLKNGAKKFVRASKEIIISCGSVDSPKLLMLSGIGPKEHLSLLKIKPRVNLPVGKFLKDHIAINVFPFLLNSNETISLIPERDFGLQTIWDYYVHAKGPLTTPAEAYSQAFFSTSHVLETGVDWPNIQLYMLSFGAHATVAQELAAAYNTKKGVYESMFKSIQGRDMFVLMSTLARPKSFGDLKLASKDPLVPPLINPNYLKEDDDVKALVEAIKFSIKLGEETKSFGKLGSKLADEHIRIGCEKYKRRSDAFWECYVRHHARTLYHPVGTCRMGRGAQDPRAVVDPSLR